MTLDDIKEILLVIALSNNDLDVIVAKLGHDWAHIVFKAYITSEAVTGDYVKGGQLTLADKAAGTLVLIANYEQAVDDELRRSQDSIAAQSIGAN